VRSRHIQKYMASTRGAAAFLKSVDCTDNMAEGGKKDSAYKASNVTVASYMASNVKQKSFLRPCASETGLLTGISTRRSETGWILQPLRSLSMFTQTAKWQQRLVMRIGSRCLLGIMKMLELSKRITASDHAARKQAAR
jgi:hypothetical protein